MINSIVAALHYQLLLAGTINNIIVRFARFGLTSQLIVTPWPSLITLLEWPNTFFIMWSTAFYNFSKSWNINMCQGGQRFSHYKDSAPNKLRQLILVTLSAQHCCNLSLQKCVQLVFKHWMIWTFFRVVIRLIWTEGEFYCYCNVVRALLIILCGLFNWFNLSLV